MAEKETASTSVGCEDLLNATGIEVLCLLNYFLFLLSTAFNQVTLLLLILGIFGAYVVIQAYLSSNESGRGLC